MARASPNITYIDTGGFLGADQKLLAKFMSRDGLGIHLNEQGLRMYASRFKIALRTRHHLPVITYRNNRNANVREPSSISNDLI